MDTYDFLADPRNLPLDERHKTMELLAAEQAHWLARLATLVEPPPPGEDFPAFLLATPAFGDLAQRIGAARTRAELPIDTADELDWFVDKFADYLRTRDGEDVFADDGDPGEATTSAGSQPTDPNGHGACHASARGGAARGR